MTSPVAVEVPDHLADPCSPVSDLGLARAGQVLPVGSGSGVESVVLTQMAAIYRQSLLAALSLLHEREQERDRARATADHLRDEMRRHIGGCRGVRVMTPRGRLLTADAIRWGNTDPAGLPQDRHTLTDAAHAERFARAFAGEFRFDHTRNLWLAWSHTRWAVDLTGRRYARAIELARELYESATREADLDARRRLATFAIGCENRARLENVLHLAKFHPLLADAGDLWDADPWALNTPGGLVDLRSGQVRPSTPADRVTFQTAVALADTADCERWRRFLREVFRGDDEIVRWLQKVMGVPSPVSRASSSW